MEIALLVVIATLVVLYMIKSVRKKYQYFDERGIPYPRPYWPLGNFWKVGLSVHFINRVNEIYREFRGTAKLCGFYIFTIPVYVILDIDLVKNILVKDFDHFHDRGITHPVMTQ
jgi:cytochrome P450 family 6